MSKSKAEEGREKQRKYQQDYYRKNREAILQQRRERYQSDPTYRKRAKKNAKTRFWRQRGKKSLRPVPSVKLSEVESVGRIDVPIENPQDKRNGKTSRVQVYTLAAVSELLGRRPQALRGWFQRGLLPEPRWKGPDFPGLVRGRGTRLFTTDEMKVLIRARKHLEVPTKRLEDSEFVVAVAAGFSELVDGVKPKLA